ncbi:MAG: superoxide dismutase, partial [Deltaproteobacteria bacterium]|nr:superoxide dismutase [Deltaproteobacteria bacterium]
MNKKCFQVVLVSLITLCVASYALAHCEVPCGIYDDNMRVKMIA